jgi:hypothetical protein
MQLFHIKKKAGNLSYHDQCYHNPLPVPLSGSGCNKLLKIKYMHIFMTNMLRVLSSEMDPAKMRLIL